VILAVLLVLLAPLAYFGYGLASTLFAVSQGTGQVAPPVEGAGSGGGGGTTYILLMGSDERRDSSGKVVKGDVPHSDTLILARVDTNEHTIRLLSVPRDLVVAIPGYGPSHRVNEAYTIGETRHLSQGGAGLAAQTIETLTGIRVPYYAVTTFDGFRETVDAVGGVELNVERPITDHDYPGQGSEYMPIYVPAGMQHLGGEKALEYVRSRHNDPLSDFGRNQRQQHFLSVLSKKLLQPERLTQFNQFTDIVKRNARSNLSPGQMLSLARAMIGGKPRLQTYAIGPNQVRDQVVAGLGDVLVPDRAAVDKVVRAFERGDPSPDQAASPSSG